MTCREVKTQLVAYDDGALAEDEARRIAAHLRGCPECRSELARLQQVAMQLRAAPAIDPGAAFDARVMAAVAHTRPTRSRQATHSIRPIAISVAMGALVVASALVLALLTTDFGAWQAALAGFRPVLDTIAEAMWLVAVGFSETVITALVVDIALVIALLALARSYSQRRLAEHARCLLA
jgi:anti-sigma factor RsiW